MLCMERDLIQGSQSYGSRYGSDADPYYGSHPDPFGKNQPRTIPKIKIRMLFVQLPSNKYVLPDKKQLFPIGKTCVFNI